MTERKLTGLRELIEALFVDGVRLIGPRRDGDHVVYKPLDEPADYVTGYISPANSPKEFLFPRSESILGFRYDAEETELIDPLEDEYPETVILGVRPCDARGLGSLTAVFDGEYRDEFFLRRRAATTIVAVSCLECDDDCFCTATGGGPDDPSGADLLLTPLKKGLYAEAVTDKGEALLKRFERLFEDPPDRALRDRAVAPVRENLRKDLDGLASSAREGLADPDSYDDPRWAEFAYRCLSCGACTFACPTCHCYDIVEEGKLGSGERKKNWDACQFDHYTLHASGHNPRPRQPFRWRNRYLCKFRLYPERWDVAGCVGCGRCIRVCPVGIDITEALQLLTSSSSPKS